jgi:hypothetical protein
MAIIEINKNPSRRELRWFGVLLALFFAIVGTVARFKWHAPAAALALWGAGVVVPALYYAVPPVRKTLYLGWVYATFPVGWVVSHAVLAVVFYGVFTPVGLLLRLLGRDSMRRAPDRATATYWVEHRSEPDPTRYFRQY